jgi:hypothetical protein
MTGQGRDLLSRVKGSEMTRAILRLIAVVLGAGRGFPKLSALGRYWRFVPCLGGLAMGAQVGLSPQHRSHRLGRVWLATRVIWPCSSPAIRTKPPLCSCSTTHSAPLTPDSRGAFCASDNQLFPFRSRTGTTNACTLGRRAPCREW